MKASVILLIISILGCTISCKESPTIKTQSTSSLKKVTPFIQGLTYLKETTTRSADTSYTYVPHFPDTVVSPYELEYLIDMDLCYEKAYYDINGEKITGYLPINIDYEFEHSLLLGKKYDNDLIFGEYDFNKDGVNEIIIGFRDNNGSKMGLQINVIRYVPPPKTETVFCDYWVTLKDIHIEEINSDSYAKIIDNRIEIMHPKSKIAPFVFDKKVFDKAVKEQEEE